MRFCRNFSAIEPFLPVLLFLFLGSFSYAPGKYHYIVNLKEEVSRRYPWGERTDAREGTLKLKFSVVREGEGLVLPVSLVWNDGEKVEFNKEYVHLFLGDTWVKLGKNGLKFECAREGEWEVSFGKKKNEVRVKWKVSEGENGSWKIKGSAVGTFRLFLIPVRREVDFSLCYRAPEGIVEEMEGEFSTQSAAKRRLGYGTTHSFRFEVKLAKVEKREGAQEDQPRQGPGQHGPLPLKPPR